MGEQVGTELTFAVIEKMPLFSYGDFNPSEEQAFLTQGYGTFEKITTDYHHKPGETIGLIVGGGKRTLVAEVVNVERPEVGEIKMEVKVVGEVKPIGQ